jgi:5-methylcytosine-specific restriction protein A
MCKAKGITRVWTELDHTVALINGGTDTDDNRVGLCRECHAEKSRRDLQQKVKPSIGMDGYPINQGSV